MLAEAKVVVIGGGVAGCSPLYHLARLGWTDAVLLEQHALTSGLDLARRRACAHSSSPELQRHGPPAAAAWRLYEALEDETGQPGRLPPLRAVRIGTTPRTACDQFHHVARDRRASVGVPFELVSAENAHRAVPADGPRQHPRSQRTSRRTGTSTRRALDQRVREGRRPRRGARILRHTPVTGLVRERGGWVIETAEGEIRAAHRRQRRGSVGAARSRGSPASTSRSSRCSTTTS